jgi:hypothetical protein
VTGNLKTPHGSALAPAERGDHAHQQDGGNGYPLTKPRPERLLNTDIGSPHARFTEEPMVVQSYLRGAVTFVTDAPLSYRNRPRGASTKRGTMVTAETVTFDGLLAKIRGRVTESRRACPELVERGRLKIFQDSVAAYFSAVPTGLVVLLKRTQD